jgi:hypothetical protein
MAGIANMRRGWSGWWKPISSCARAAPLPDPIRYHRQMAMPEVDAE